MQKKIQKQFKIRDYEKQLQMCVKFLREFKDPSFSHPKYKQHKYMAQMQEIVDRKRSNLAIEIQDVEAFYSKKQSTLAADILNNTPRYIQLFHHASF